MNIYTYIYTDTYVYIYISYITQHTDFQIHRGLFFCFNKSKLLGKILDSLWSRVCVCARVCVYVDVHVHAYSVSACFYLPSFPFFLCISCPYSTDLSPLWKNRFSRPFFFKNNYSSIFFRKTQQFRLSSQGNESQSYTFQSVSRCWNAVTTRQIPTS